MTASHAPEVLSIINEQPHVCKKSDFDMTQNNQDFDWRHIERFIWCPCLHYGGTFCSKEQFDEAGGFSETYHNWGMEDEDFHWKLNELYDVRSIREIMPPCVLHFEHHRNYNNSTYQANRESFIARRNGAFHDILNHDRAGLARHKEQNSCIF